MAASHRAQDPEVAGPFLEVLHTRHPEGQTQTLNHPERLAAAIVATWNEALKGQHKLAQFVAPDGSQGDGQQQAFEAAGMFPAGVVDIEAAGLVIAERSLNLHPQAIFVQALGVSAISWGA